MRRVVDRHIALIMLRRVPVALLMAAAVFAAIRWVFGWHWGLAAAGALFAFGATVLYGPQGWEPDTSLSHSSGSSSSSSADSDSD